MKKRIGMALGSQLYFIIFLKDSALLLSGWSYIQCTSDIVTTLGHPFLATFWPLSGHFLVTISDLNIIEQMDFVPGKVATISEWPL